MKVLSYQIDEPPAAAGVGRILPHGLDAGLEDGVVAVGAQARRQLDVVVHGPEVLHRAESHHLKTEVLRYLSKRTSNGLLASLRFSCQDFARSFL